MGRLVGVLGGSFNPVHIGHMALANYLVEMTDLDQVWLTLSPQNPLKSGCSQASDADRLAMLAIATDQAHGISVCDIELDMPRPSYTIDTLRRLSQLYPDHAFRLIIGSDNWAIFDRWRQGDEIINRYGVIVYPRPGYPIDHTTLPDGITVVDAPTMEISSTMIRGGIARGRELNYFLPHGVYKYIKDHKLYEK